MASGYPPPPSISMLHDRNGGEKRRKRPPNTGSKLLDSQENYYLFSMLGCENVSLSAAVVELLHADGRQWRQQIRGVICLVKDYEKRAYYMRIYDLISGREIWGFKLYKGFHVTISSGCTQLLIFEGETEGQVFGLNFSSIEEARDFKGHLDKRHEQEKKTVSSREQRAPSLPPTSAYGGSSMPVSGSVTPVPSKMAAGPSSFGTGGVTPVGTMVHTEKTPSSSGGGLFSRNKKNKADKKQRIRKEDISNPTNFQHKAHVGWDQDNGFSNNVYDSEPMDESIQNIIRAAGQDPSNMSKKTIKFVYDFLEQYKSPEDSFDSPSVAPVVKPPPVPVSQPISQWNTPPPPPPSRGASHQVVSAAPPSRPPPPPPSSMGRPPPRPLPQVPPVQDFRPAAVPPPPPPPPPSFNVSSSSIPPPPPPPPPNFGAASSVPPPPPSSVSVLPQPPSGRGNLLAEIQAGRSLRSVGENVSNSNSNADSRGDVMAQIRLGAQLKHVDTSVEQEKRKSGNNVSEMGGIAGALAKALEERRQNMGIDDSSDEDESDEKNEWSD